MNFLKKKKLLKKRSVGEITISSTCCQNSNWFWASHFQFHATCKIWFSVEKYYFFSETLSFWNVVDVFPVKNNVFFYIQYKEQGFWNLEHENKKLKFYKIHFLLFYIGPNPVSW